MKKIRIGNTILAKWAITIDGEEVPLYDYDLSLALYNPVGEAIPMEFTIEDDNIIVFKYEGKDQTKLGKYRLTLYHNHDLEDQHVLDACDAFQLVSCTCKTEAGEHSNLELVVLELRGNISINGGGEAQGAVRYDIEQELSTEEKERARNNIGVGQGGGITPEEVREIVNEETYNKEYIDENKQDTLIAGEGITIENNVISSTGGSAEGAVRFDEEQHLTDSQQRQARANINAKKGGYTRIEKLHDYLHEVWYDGVDYSLADLLPHTPLGGCASIRKGKFFARNLDWQYSEAAEFFVHTPAAYGRHAVDGFGGNIPSLTKEVVESGVWHPAYQWLPLAIADGHNDAGLCASMNVVPTKTAPDTYEKTTGTNPDKPTLNGLMIVRYILDNHTDALSAAQDIANNWNVVMPHTDTFDQELHFLIADKTRTIVLEFVGNEAVIIQKPNQEGYITNFRLNGVDETSIVTMIDTIEPFGQGVERYGLIKQSTTIPENKMAALLFMSYLWYTNAYTLQGDDVWRTDFAGLHDDLTVQAAAATPSVYDETLAAAHEAYLNRTRNGETWQTTHSVVYDIESGECVFLVQQDIETYTQRDMALPIDAYTKAETDALLEDKQDALNYYREGTYGVGDYPDVEVGAKVGSSRLTLNGYDTTIDAKDLRLIITDTATINGSEIATATDLAAKQDTISDLATIRTGASAGATALQPSDIASWAKQPTKPAYTASEVGALPDDTEIPSKTSDLTNDSGFIGDAPSDNKQYARKNGAWSEVTGGGGGADPEAVHFTPQTLTEAQKEQARKNIADTTRRPFGRNMYPEEFVYRDGSHALNADGTWKSGSSTFIFKITKAHDRVRETYNRAFICEGWSEQGLTNPVAFSAIKELTQEDVGKYIAVCHTTGYAGPMYSVYGENVWFEDDLTSDEIAKELEVIHSLYRPREYRVNAYTAAQSTFRVSPLIGLHGNTIRHLMGGCDDEQGNQAWVYATEVVKDMQYINQCNLVLRNYVQRYPTTGVTSLYDAFSGCYYLESADLCLLDVSLVTTMYQMFYKCSSLATLDVSGWDVSAVTNMGYMFYNCSSLTTLDVSGWNTGAVTTMTSMFYNCSSLTTLDVSGWNTGAVTTMTSMFYNCSSLTTLDTSGWNVSAVTSMQSMFYGCSSLATLDVSGWDVSAVTNMGYMFYNCSSLTTLDVSGWNTGAVTSMGYMFYNCSSLTTLDTSGWDVSAVTSMGYMFYNCSSLTTLIGGSQDLTKVALNGTNVALSLNQCNLLDRASLRAVINGLADRTGQSQLTLTLGATNKAKLTDEDILIATNKNWRIA